MKSGNMMCQKGGGAMTNCFFFFPFLYINNFIFSFTYYLLQIKRICYETYRWASSSDQLFPVLFAPPNSAREKWKQRVPWFWCWFWYWFWYGHGRCWIGYGSLQRGLKGFSESKAFKAIHIRFSLETRMSLWRWERKPCPNPWISSLTTLCRVSLPISITVSTHMVCSMVCSSFLFVLSFCNCCYVFGCSALLFFCSCTVWLNHRW